jgi:uncharacterized protein YbjT (DUF2867 family)
MSALGTSEQTRDLVPYYHAKWEQEQDAAGLRARARDLPPELRFRPRRRDPADLPQLAKLTPVTPIIGSGRQRIQPIWIEDVAAYFAAGVDRPRPRTGSSSSAAPTR